MISHKATGEMSSDGRFELSKSVVFRPERFGGIVHNRKTFRFYFLNRTCADLLSILVLEPLSVSRAVKILSLLYDAPPGILERDVEQAIRTLLKADVIRLTATRINEKDNRAIAQSIRTNRASMPQWSTAPIEVTLNLTSRCNQACIFCYNAYARARSLDHRLPSDAWLAFVDQLVEARVFDLILLGGEPWLESDLIFEILERATPELAPILVTNGTGAGGISPSQAARLAQHPNLEVGVSLQGACAETHDRLVGLPGAYDTAIRSVKNLVEAGVITVIKMVGIQSNIEEAIPLAQVANDLGAAGFVLQDLIPCFEDTPDSYWRLAVPPDEYTEVVNHLNSYQVQLRPDFFIQAPIRDPFHAKVGTMDGQPPLAGCSAGFLDLEVASNGDVYPCVMTLGRPEYKMGNITSQTLEEMWNDDSGVLEFFRNRDPKNLHAQVCQQCSNRESCKGGCPLTSLILHGHEYAGDPTCPKVYASMQNNYHSRVIGWGGGCTGVHTGQTD